LGQVVDWQPEKVGTMSGAFCAVWPISASKSLNKLISKNWACSLELSYKPKFARSASQFLFLLVLAFVLQTPVAFAASEQANLTTSEIAGGDRLDASIYQLASVV